MKVGVLAAMPQEIALLEGDLSNARRHLRGMRGYLQGTLYGKDAVLVLSRMAKVAAASTVTTLIEVFGVDCVVLTGVAGAADSRLEIGDVVVGTALVQHDLDARPLFPRFEVPLLGRCAFEAAPGLAALARQSAETYLGKYLLADIPAETLRAFGIGSPKVLAGLVASGDQFIADPGRLAGVRSGLIGAGLPPPLCVEMEGAAVAQVCYEHAVPAVVMRTISDKADHSAAIDFMPFVDRVASRFTRGIVRELIARL